MPKTYSVEDGVDLSYYLVGEPGSGTESLIPQGVTSYQDYEEIKASLAPGQLFEDPYFDAVESSIAYNPKEKDNEIEDVEKIEWLRPKEILEAKGVQGEPLFIDNGGDPEKVGNTDDVNQNILGDCWFLCSMAELSRLPDVFWMVVCKENVTQFSKEEYKGIFKFRFAAFGRLIEVVVDDRIPFLRSSGDHWSVQSDNPRVFWSALMEKAYAKLYSAYQAIQGGWIGDALQDFTGGVVDRYDLEEVKKNELWKIIVDATKAGFYMGASVMKDFDDENDEEAWFEKTGLGNNHAYSVLTAKELKIRGKRYKLLRIRNPWGNLHEFKGKFNEETGSLWKRLDKATKEEFPAGEDGEFWMDLPEFMKNFKMLEVLNLNPFGSKGKTLEELCDDIDFTRLLQDGEWTEENSFGGLRKDEEEEEEADAEEGGEEDEAEDEEASEEDDEDDLEDEAVDDEDEAGDHQEAEELTEAEYNTFCLNPQIKFTVPEVGLDEEGQSEVVLTLLQRYRRNLQKTGGKEVYIGMAVARIENEYPVKGSDIFNGTSLFEDLQGVEYRAHTVRVSLTPGQYVLIPYTKASVYAEFTVIIFTRK